MGDKTHPSSTQIYAMVEEIEARLREYGHQPSTASMLFDVLSYHSERLAIAAYALIASAPGVPIRINKNLRVHMKRLSRDHRACLQRGIWKRYYHEGPDRILSWGVLLWTVQQ
jgi:hypothetical protein